MLYMFAGKERAGNYDAMEDPNWGNGLVRKGAPQSSETCTRLFSCQGLPGPSRDVSCSVKETYLPATVKQVRQPSSTYAIAVQSLSHAQLFVTPWTAVHQASLSFTISRSLLKLMFSESMMPSNHLVLRLPLHFLLSVFLNIRVFSNELMLCISWPMYWSFSFSINPSNEYLGLISFTIDWFDLLDVQGTLKSLFQCHSSKASILYYSAFFVV